ncbi:hypothetical protein EAO75_26670 [Streptomyces sp. uw30]|uniref:hypothetical protein n=1 Tax=Streptomyces sp. uw30 TaxID=1828179 RepID=UPI0011CD4A75|nr:hypothetical protein [Streptomyces sp. uw30]TXS46318.1 hypothetical protein EAO75_26670 [Streptomyces sp. uw30]
MKEPQQSSRGADAVLRALAPPPALCGFLLLLALIFTASYAVGAVSGPVAPGMHGPGTSGDGGGTDTGDTGDMGDMGDMDMRHGSGS